ncbi:MAG: lamin tail domain-containing protein, partial [Bacteroidota bacterium]
MIRRLLLIARAVVIMGELATVCSAQISTFPYVQNFDSVQPPALPSGWSSTQNRTPGVNDFTTGTTNPHSGPYCVGSTNARITQSLTSPLFDFSNTTPDSLSFYVLRSSSHTARMLIEASLDSGATFSLQLSDSLRNTTTTYTQVKLSLPPILATSRATQFRWRIVGDPSSGATATLRIDDIAVTALRAVDLSLSEVRFRPPTPIENDSVSATAKIINVGQQSAQNFSAEFYVDANNDSLPQPPELRATVFSSSSLVASDSVELSGSIGTFSPGSQLVIAKVVHAPDQNLSNNQRLAPLQVGYRAQSIVVNEIMYAPTGTEPEWVELFNTQTDSINLKSWLMSDNVVTTKRVIASQSLFIPSNSYVVLTRDSAALLDIHPNIRVRVVNVSGFPSLNNTGDAVVLYDNRVATMDSVAYLPSWGGSTNGYSVERIDPLGSSTQQTNWGTSRSIRFSTPGERNSLSRKDRDLAVDSLRVSPSLPVAGDTLQIVVPIKNLGRETVAGFTVQLFYDMNSDSLPQPAELIASTIRSSPLSPLDSTIAQFSIQNIQAGTRIYISRVEFGGDEDSTNNKRLSHIVVGYPVGTVRINEIMYAPNAGVPEWVELFNTRTDTVEINKWLIGNRSASSRYEISASRLQLPPNDFMVIAKDTALLRVAYPLLSGRIVQTTSLPTFLWSNNGDAGVLADSRKVIMDSVFYRPTWGGNSGKSLERIDPLAAANDSVNWASSLDTLGATPTRKNSQVRLDNDLRLVRVSSDTISAGTNARLNVVVQNVGKLASSQFELRLFDDVDRDSVGSSHEQFQQLTITQTLAARESTIAAIEWNRPASGIHYVIAQINYSADQRLSNNKGFSSVRVGFSERALVINEIMFAPLTDNAEYIEFYNASQSDVDVGQWKVHDRVNSGSANEFKLSTKSKMVHAGESFVLASDSSLLRMYSSPSSDDRLFTIVNQSSLSLNNDGDDIVLVDPSGTIIDSVSYSPSW